MPPIEERELKSWSDLVKVADHLDVGDVLQNNYLFRGQQDAGWKLTPSLHRAVTKGGRIAMPNTGELVTIEKALTSRFQAAAPVHLHPTIFSSTHNTVDWWFLMRHFGAPTRLLDWTASIYVAAYFAASGAPDKDGGIYVVHINTLDKAMNDVHGPKAKFPYGTDFEKAILAADALPIVLFMGRVVGHLDRMIAQQGVFMTSLNAGADVEAIMSEEIPRVSAPHAMTLTKLRIRSADKPVFMRRLRAMNVTGSSLFPGLDGIGLHLTELTQFRD